VPYLELGNGAHFLLLPVSRLFFETEKPHVDGVYAVNAFAEDIAIGILVDIVVVVTALQVLDDAKEVFDFGVHHPQVADKSDFFNVERTAVGRFVWQFVFHSFQLNAQIIAGVFRR
jgi:hypothetical protein